jgi:sec-independent protein translocase protein TatA
MFGLGFQELSIIVVILVLLFGLRRWPQLKTAASEAVQNLRDGISGDDEIDVTPKRDRDPKDDPRA